MANNFDQELEVMKMYTANASLYIKLSTSALALTVAFPEKVLKLQGQVLDFWAVLIWIAFLLAIGAGAFYHYLAGKYMERLLAGGAGFPLWDWLADQCEIVYGAMLLTFYAGAILFTFNAIFGIIRAPK